MGDTPQFERPANGVLVQAPAKVNLSLLIAGKRHDGYHELETLMAGIDWSDEVLIQPGGQGAIELICQGPEWAPQSKDNLVYRAAELILARCGQRADIRLTLTKNVPAGTGLGSASSDAAATLMGINEYLDLGLPAKSLADMAGRLGSDVAFFLNGPLALCTGRGEKVQGLPRSFPFTALLVLPSVSVSTKEIYAHYSHDPAQYERWRRQIDGYLRADRIDMVARMGANMLQQTCFGLFKELGRLKEVIEALGVGPLCLSGSGSAMFVILNDRDIERVEQWREQIAGKTGCRTRVVRSRG
jgi:4-diphosphocytidyl-2-C-methyl-D-erythritol kinase